MKYIFKKNKKIFGGMSPCKLHQSEHYYGTGESFLFSFYPSFRVSFNSIYEILYIRILFGLFDIFVFLFGLFGIFFWFWSYFG